MQTVMKRSAIHNTTRLFAILAVVVQALLPGALAAARSNGTGDVARFICAPSGELSSEIKAATAQFLELMGDETPDDQSSSDGHCPLCPLVAGALLPEPVAPAARLRFTTNARYFSRNVGFARSAQGPPLGSRGPPRHP